MKNKYSVIFLSALICFRIGFLLYQHKDKYVPDYWTRFESLKDVYWQSQYSMKDWKYWIPDETVHAYAGGAYVKGANPILVEYTQPPFGKYLIGLSILVSGNEHSAGAVFFIFLLIGIFILARMMTGNVIVALLTTLIASFERLIVDQLTYSPLLDIFLMTFVLYAVITASYAIKKSKPVYITLSFILLGLSMMTKVWLIGAVFVSVLMLYIVVKRPKYYLFILGGGLGILIITLLSYTRMFADGYTLLEVLKVQKWLYWYQGGKLNRLFTVWPLIFLNKWYVWWGDIPVIQDANWSVTWPIFIGSGLVGSVWVLWSIFRKTEPAVQLSALSILAYAVFISLGQASARYLLPFLPMCLCMTMWVVFSIGKSVVWKRKHRRV